MWLRLLLLTALAGEFAIPDASSDCTIDRTPVDTTFRYLMLNPRGESPQNYFSFQHVPFIYQGVDMIVTRDHSNPFPPSVTVSLDEYYIQCPIALHLLSHASWAADIPQNTELGRVIVHFAATGETEILPLVIGENTAEWAYDRPELVDCLQHNKLRELEAYNAITDINSISTYCGHFGFYSTLNLTPYALRSPTSLELILNWNLPGLDTTSCASPEQYNVVVNAVTIEHAFPSPVERHSWGRLKARYR